MRQRLDGRVDSIMDSHERGQGFDMEAALMHCEKAMLVNLAFLSCSMDFEFGSIACSFSNPVFSLCQIWSGLVLVA